MMKILHFELIREHGSEYALFYTGREGVYYDLSVTLASKNQSTFQQMLDCLTDKRWAYPELIEEFKALVLSRQNGL